MNATPLAEDHGVGREGDGCAVLAGGAELLNATDRLAAGEGLSPLETVLPRSDLDAFRQGVDDTDADPVQATGCLVGLAGEFSAGVQDGHDDLKR